MSINLNKETKKISGKYIYINDAKKDYIQNISLESDIYQEVIEEEKGTTLEGESVVISDGDINKEVKAIVNGNSYQETTEGYQELNLPDYTETKNGVTVTVKNGEVSMSGKLTAVTSFYIPITDIELKTTDIFSVALNDAKTIPNGFGRYLTDIDKNLIRWTYGMAGLNDNTGFSPTTDTVAKYFHLALNTIDVDYTGVKFKPMFEKGNVSHEFEPYTNGASPNTEYEQDIEVVDGVNKFNIEDYTDGGKLIDTVTSDKLVVTSKLATEYTYEQVIYFNNVKLKKGITYTLRRIMKVLSGTPKTGTGQMELYIGGTWKKVIGNGSATGYDTKNTFTVDEDNTYRIRIKIANANDVTEPFTVEFSNLMIYEGIEEKPYLPYGHIGLVQRGKNIFKTSKCEFNPNNASIETSTDNEVVENSYGAWSRIACTINGLKPNTNYIISSNIFNPSGAFCGFHAGGGKTALSKETNFSAKISSKTNDNGIFYVEFYNNYSSTGINNLIVTYTNIQLEEGTVATEFEPYHYNLTPINLNGNSIAKVGDIKDILNISVDGSVSIEKKTGKTILTGNENWSKNIGYTYVYFCSDFRDILVAYDTDAKCNYFKYVADYSKSDYSFAINGSKAIIFRNTDLAPDDLATFKAWLKGLYDNGTPLYIVHKLAEEYYETIPLPSIEPIELFEGTNIFELVTNLGTTMALTYNYVTPSPSIDRPSEIKTPVGKQELYVGNKNLAYNVIYHQNNTSANSYLVVADYKIIEGCYYKISWKCNVDNQYITINKGEQYGFDRISSTNGIIKGKENVVILKAIKSGTFKKVQLLARASYQLDTSITVKCSDFVLEKIEAINDSEALAQNTFTNYIEHQSQVQDLDVGELLGPIVDKEDGSYFENRYGKYVVTGDEGWGLFENNKRIDLYKSVFKKTNSNNQYCNYFKKCEEYALSPHSFYISQNVCRFYNDWKFTSNDEINAKFKELYNNGTPIEVVYELATPTYTKLTETQQAQWNAIKKMHTYEGVTNIYTINENGISPVINLEYTTKYAEEYDFYIDENARFIVPEYGINYQVSMTESDLSDMPEASESAVKIAGKDGDVVLNTTYEPKDFNIVAYTDDNLEPKDKEAEKTKLVNFLHSIKNRTKNFGLLYREKFYPVKYNDKLTPTIYPKSIRFEIPIKSSKSLGYALEKKMIFGNGKEISNTIEETGCKIIIEGPIYGTNDSPMVITLNDYQMAYYNTVLEGNRLEIDTNNSTIKHISSNGEVTNVAAYYNHEYPKIKYGENEIKILSKIDSETQVYTEWYDLKI